MNLKKSYSRAPVNFYLALISFTGGVLIAVLMVVAMFIMYSCLISYHIRMM